jgi:hypothetical protein
MLDPQKNRSLTLISPSPATTDTAGIASASFGRSHQTLRPLITKKDVLRISKRLLRWREAFHR